MDLTTLIDQRAKHCQRQIDTRRAAGETRPMRTPVENSEFTKFARRIIRAHGRRVAQGDPVDLAELEGLRKDLDMVIDYAVRTMRENYGYSWAEIGRELKITRQAAQQRYGR